ncbi:MAG TPA: hypothetical protein DIT46_01125 [Gemmatimonadetes bacterium]|nr:hypothetical protein [Gemmatimonadota bacterium]
MCTSFGAHRRIYTKDTPLGATQPSNPGLNSNPRDFRQALRYRNQPEHYKAKDFMIRKGERGLTPMEVRDLGLHREYRPHPVRDEPHPAMQQSTSDYKKHRGVSTLPEHLRKALPKDTPRVVRRYGSPQHLRRQAQENYPKYAAEGWAKYNAAVRRNTRLAQKHARRQARASRRAQAPRY